MRLFGRRAAPSEYGAAYLEHNIPSRLPAKTILDRHLDPGAGHFRRDFRAELQRHPGLDRQEVEFNRNGSDISWLIHGFSVRDFS